jgi:manganese/zinc/iron transport system permease protein
MTDLLQMGVLSAIACTCGLLSPFLVLKKMTMFANSLSHTVLLGIALAFLVTGGAVFNLSVLLIGALLAALMTALFTGGLIRFFRLQEDASIGLVFTALFALGIAVVTLYLRDTHLGIEAVMGNADLLQFSDLKLSLLMVGFNGSVILLFYRQLQLCTFDANLAKILNIRRDFFQFLLLFLVAMTCIGAFRAVGVLLVLSFLVGPFLTARLFCHRLPKLLILTPLIGIGASLLGVLISRSFLNLFGVPLSTAGIVATLIGLIYVFGKTIQSARLYLCERKLQS